MSDDELRSEVEALVDEFILFTDDTPHSSEPTELSVYLRQCGYGDATKRLVDDLVPFIKQYGIQIEKGYGNCHNCYGKGYSTVKSQILGHGTDGDIGGYEGKFKRDTPVKMKFCDCDRGRQLEHHMEAYGIQERIKTVEALESELEPEGIVMQGNMMTYKCNVEMMLSNHKAELTALKDKLEIA